nr:MAG: hypothetical protein [Jingmen bat rhabdovirus 3]
MSSLDYGFILFHMLMLYILLLISVLILLCLWIIWESKLQITTLNWIIWANACVDMPDYPHEITNHVKLQIVLLYEGEEYKLQETREEDLMTYDEFEYIDMKLRFMRTMFDRKYYSIYYPTNSADLDKGLKWLEDRHFKVLYATRSSPPPKSVYNFYQNYFPQFLEAQSLVTKHVRLRRDTL